MHIELEGYTKEMLIKYLTSNVRNVWYEYTVADINDKTIGRLMVSNATVSFDSSQEIMRTFSGTARTSEIMDINVIDERIIPWMCMQLPEGSVVRWPLGRFIINPSGDYNDGLSLIKISGYDMAKIAYDDKNDSRYLVKTDTIYTSAAAQILGDIYKNTRIVPSTKTKSNGQEWQIGTRKLTIVNELMKSINYNPLHFDEYGTAILDEYIFPENRQTDIIYSASENSIILDGISINNNKFEIANKFVRYTENVDSQYYISTYVNNDESSPYSTVTRGRIITDAASVNDIATQADLDSYVRRIAMSAIRSTEKISINTINMPGHGYQDIIYLDIPQYDISGKYVETAWEMELSTGGSMKHELERVV